jgi:hypothetical protein
LAYHELHEVVRQKTQVLHTIIDDIVPSGKPGERALERSYEQWVATAMEKADRVGTLGMIRDLEKAFGVRFVKEIERSEVGQAVGAQGVMEFRPRITAVGLLAGAQLLPSMTGSPKEPIVRGALSAAGLLGSTPAGAYGIFKGAMTTAEIASAASGVPAIRLAAGAGVREAAGKAMEAHLTAQEIESLRRSEQGVAVQRTDGKPKKRLIIGGS